MSHTETAREKQTEKNKCKMFPLCLTSIHYVTSRLHVFEFTLRVSNLSTEATEETKPYVHEGKAAGLKQKVAQEEGNAPV